MHVVLHKYWLVPNCQAEIIIIIISISKVFAIRWGLVLVLLIPLVTLDTLHLMGLCRMIGFHLLLFGSVPYFGLGQNTEPHIDLWHKGNSP